MRVWDVPVNILCRKHLLAQHVEIHSIYTVISQNRKGYSFHPEVLRWRGHLSALVAKHNETVGEMTRRKYCHKTPILFNDISAISIPAQLETEEDQRKRLKMKGCECMVY